MFILFALKGEGVSLHVLNERKLHTKICIRHI